jgi:hypothetical protein
MFRKRIINTNCVHSNRRIIHFNTFSKSKLPRQFFPQLYRWAHKRTLVS